MKKITSLLIASFVLSLPALATAQIVAPGEKDLQWHSRLVQTVKNSSDTTPVITKVAMRPGVRHAISVGDDHKANLIFLDTGRIIQSMTGHTNWIRTAIFSPDGQFAYTAGADRKIIRWDLKNDTWQVFSQHPKSIESISISPNGRLLAAVGFEKNIRIYDTQSGLRVFSDKTPCNDMRVVKFSPSGNTLATAGRCGTVALWKYQSQDGHGRWIKSSSIKADKRRIHTLEFLNENTVITGSQGRLINQVNLATKEVSTISTLTGEIFDIKILNNNWLAVSGSSNDINILDIKTGKTIGLLKGHTGTVSCLAKGNGKLLSGSYDTQVRLWTIPAAGDDHLTNSNPATFDVGGVQRSASLPSTTPTLQPIRRK